MAKDKDKPVTEGILPDEIQAQLDRLTRDKAWEVTLDSALIAALTWGFVKINTKVEGYDDFSEVSAETWAMSLMGALALVALSKNVDGNAEIAVTATIMATLGIAAAPWEKIKDAAIDTWWKTAKLGSPVFWVMDKVGVADDVKSWIEGLIG